MHKLILISGVFAVVLAGCGPKSPEAEAEERAAARANADATATVLAIPTVIAEATALANANATATAQAEATASAQVQATQQARDVESRVQAALAATQAAMPTPTPVPPTDTPVPIPTQTPVVVFVPQTVPPVYVPVPAPAPSGVAPQYVIDAINDSNNAYSRAKWNLNTNEFYGHIIGKELSDAIEYVRGLIKTRTRVDSHLGYGNVTSWYSLTPTRVIATTNETWRFTNYDADKYTLKKDNGARLYRNIYTIDYVSGLGWKVSLDEVPNRNGEPV